MYIVYACLDLPYLAYITVDLNPADWAASVAQLAERPSNTRLATQWSWVRILSEAAQCFFHCLPSDFALLSLLAYFPLCIYMYKIDHVCPPSHSSTSISPLKPHPPFLSFLLSLSLPPSFLHALSHLAQRMSMVAYVWQSGSTPSRDMVSNNMNALNLLPWNRRYVTPHVHV